MKITTMMITIISRMMKKIKTTTKTIMTTIKIKIMGNWLHSAFLKKRKNMISN